MAETLECTNVRNRKLIHWWWPQVTKLWVTFWHLLLLTHLSLTIELLCCAPHCSSVFSAACLLLHQHLPHLISLPQHKKSDFKETATTQKENVSPKKLHTSQADVVAGTLHSLWSYLIQHSKPGNKLWHKSGDMRRGSAIPIMQHDVWLKDVCYDTVMWTRKQHFSTLWYSPYHHKHKSIPNILKTMPLNSKPKHHQHDTFREAA